jgi:abhydrolase domain-containing protein 6
LSSDSDPPRRKRLPLLLALLLLVPTALLLDREASPRPPHRAVAVHAAGLRWRVLEAGRGDTTLVLVHGYGEHLLTWRGVVDALATRYRVVAMDLPGFGATDKPATGYSLEGLAARVEALLAEVARPPLVLIGHSMGGAIVSELALEHPEGVEALVLIAPAGLEAGLGRVAQGGDRAARAIGWWEAARSFLTPLHDPDWMAEPAPFADYDPATDPAYRTAAEGVLREFDFEGIGSRFAGLRVPTLVIWGRHDPVISFAASEPLRSLLPCAQVAPLRALHRPQVERPDTVASLILNFLADPGCD